MENVPYRSEELPKTQSDSSGHEIYAPENFKPIDSHSSLSLPSLRGSPTGQPVEKGCGCGECTIGNHLLHIPCPKAVGSSFFPYLDTKCMDPREIRELESCLLKDNQDIMLKFSALWNNLRRSLAARGISPLGLANCLVGLEAFDSRHPSAPLLSASIGKISKAETLDEAFFEIRNYVSFFNHAIVEHIITQIGSKEDENNLAKFKAEFEVYSKRHVYRCPPHVYGSEAKHWQTDLVLKISENCYREFALNQIPYICMAVANVLGVQPHTLHLKRVDEGCIQLTFWIPNFVADVVFSKELSIERERALVKEGIFQLNCNGYQFLPSPLEV